MTRRNRKLIKLAAVAGVAVAVGAFVAGPRDEAGAATTDPVAYNVGGVHVFMDRQRNESCSISRNLLNTSDVPVFVIGTALWDDLLTDGDLGNNGGVFPQVGDSQYTGAQWLQPGEQITAVWNGVDRDPPTLTRGALQLSWSVILQPGVDVGFGHLEFVDACVESPPVDTVPPTVDTTPPQVPPSTVGSTVPGSSTTPPPPPVDETAPPPFAEPGRPDMGTQVLTSSVGPLEELPRTGAAGNVGLLALVGGFLVLVGATLRKLGRQVGRR